ncbi:hypothetical protein PFISCL1PPCAC_20896, partial [Pristionchus fissidentatus]
LLFHSSPHSLLLFPSPSVVVPFPFPLTVVYESPVHTTVTMTADPLSILSFFLAVTFTVAQLVLLCSKQVEKQPTERASHKVPLVDDGDLDEVEPKRRQVERADEINAGKKGNKHEYMTLKQLQPSESFNNSIGLPSLSQAPPKK